MMLREIRRALIVVGCAAAVMFVGAPAGARAELKPPVIAVVDVQYLLHESTAGKGVQKAIESQRETYGKEISGQEEKLRHAEQELARQRGTLSEEAFGKKRHDFEKQVMDFQRDVQARQKSIDQGLNEAMRTLQNTTIEVIAGLVQERGINLVLSKQQVVIVEKTMDLTQEVMEKLNQKLPSVSVKIPPPKR